MDETEKIIEKAEQQGVVFVRLGEEKPTPEQQNLPLLGTDKPHQNDMEIDLSKVAEAVNGNIDLAIFFLKWLEKGKNATRAYLALHPNVTRRSAAVLGHDQLKRIDVPLVLESLGIGYRKYLRQLKEGIEANKYVPVGFNTYELVPDHQTRRPYHQVLGRLIGIEQPRESTNVSIQVNSLFAEQKKKYDL